MAWPLVFVFMVLCVSLPIASVLRANLRPLQAFHVPNAITAGFAALGLMELVRAAVPDPALGKETLGNIVYHHLAVGFISIALKKRKRYMSKTSRITAFYLAFIVGIYLVDYAFIRFVVFLLGTSGAPFAIQFGTITWAYHSFFATLFALPIAALLDRFNLRRILDDGTLTAAAIAGYIGSLFAVMVPLGLIGRKNTIGD